MRLSIAPKLFLGFLAVIFLNVFFFVIVSKMENVSDTALILKRQNEIKNDLLRLKTLHRVQGPSVISFDKVGRPESVENFKQIHEKIVSLYDTLKLKIDTIVSLDSVFSNRAEFNQSEPATKILRKYINSVNIYNSIYYNMFDSLVISKMIPGQIANDRVPVWRNVINDADYKLANALDSADTFIDDQTNLRIRDVDSRVSNIRQMTISIIGAITLFALIFGIFFSRAITNSMRRLKESATNIGKGDFDIDQSGYPNDEIGDLAKAFSIMAIDLKNTQEELVRSKRLAAIGEIVASVNHEINNPLMIISGNAQFLEIMMEEYPQEMRERVRTILEETERISNVTRKLREIKNPIVEDYTSTGEQMINLDKSS